MASTHHQMSVPLQREPRNPIACRNCRHLKKRCRVDEGSQKCQRCIHGDLHCVFVAVANDIDPSAPVLSLPVTPPFPTSGPSSQQSGPNPMSPCPYVVALYHEFSQTHSASNPGTLAIPSASSPGSSNSGSPCETHSRHRCAAGVCDHHVVDSSQ